MWVACVTFIVVGLANAAALIAIDTYVQAIVPEKLRGRVWALRFTLTQGVYAVSVLAGGALASVVDVRAAVRRQPGRSSRSRRWRASSRAPPRGLTAA